MFARNYADIVESALGQRMDWSSLPALFVMILPCREAAVLEVEDVCRSRSQDLKGQQSFSLKNSHESNQEIFVLQSIVWFIIIFHFKSMCQSSMC